jgi:hypothetical protein
VKPFALVYVLVGEAEGVVFPTLNVHPAVNTEARSTTPIRRMVVFIFIESTML